MAKATGNITTGQTIAKQKAAGKLVPFTVVRFYGPGTPERVAGKDVFVTGWYKNRHGGHTYTIRVHVGATWADTVVDRQETDKVGIYVDQADARADFHGE